MALRSMATGRPEVPALWVLTARTGAGGRAVQETLSMLQRANATFIRVAAMSDSAVADMVCDGVRASADESLLNLAAKAHGNPFLVSELLGGLDEEGRLRVAGRRAVATGDALPRRLRASMQQRLDVLSGDASEVVRVAAVLPDRFSAGVLAAMLERQPASLMSAVEEAVRMDLLVEDGEQLRFRHDLLREATRQSLPQSMRRAMERQSASIMLSMGWAPDEVATQLARSAEPGDREAVSALREAAQSVGRSDAPQGHQGGRCHVRTRSGADRLPHLRGTRTLTHHRQWMERRRRRGPAMASGQRSLTRTRSLERGWAQ
jgi:hypothetical protein